MYENQGRCLQSAKNPDFMKIYDDFDPAARKRLRESAYDLCAACVRGIAIDIMRERHHYGLSDIYICEAIDQMERQIRAGDVPQAQ